MVEKAAAPGSHWEKLGSVTVKKSGTKMATLRSIASEILKARQREAKAIESKPQRK
jgi:signal recognition particle subunit SEC65